jgi:membrane complex biogenesis BtpA family protein
MRLSDLFAEPKPIIAAVHLPPLPGSPAYGGSMDEVVDAALRDAAALRSGGVDGLIVENLGDAPFLKTDVPPETVAAMSRVVAELTATPAGELPFGINVLRNDGRAALAIAEAFGGSFVRVNVLTEAYATDQGLIEGIAADLLRARRLMGAERVVVFADVHVKHGAPLLQRPIRESAEDMVERGGADVLVVSGPRTGSAADLADVAAVSGLGADVVLGSGVSTDSVEEALRVADGAIVATAFRPGGDLSKGVDARLVERFMDPVRAVRSSA